MSNAVVRYGANGMTVSTPDGQVHKIGSDKDRDRASSIIIADLQRKGYFSKKSTNQNSDRMGL